VQTLLACLRAGSPAVVAYDRDPNTHLPCLQQGTSAHWGAVRGVVFLSTQASGSTSTRNFEGSATENNYDASVNDNGSLMVLVEHTMSAHPFVCSFAELVASNAQLHMAKKDTARWVVPEGGPNLRGLLVPTVSISPQEI